jgi:hypothetical protein
MSLFPLRLTLPVSLFWLAFVLIAFSDAASSLIISMLTVLVIGLWGLSWIIRGVFAIAQPLTSRSKTKPAQFKKQLKEQLKNYQNWLKVGIEPATILLSMVLIAFAIPTSIRVKLSEPALTAYVQDIQAGRRSPQTYGEAPRQVGLFTVKETELLDDGIVRLITTEAFLNHAGFVYSPHQTPPTLGEDYYQHLYGNWWNWQRQLIW